MSRKIINCELLLTGYGTHHYYAEWEGDFTDDELITAIDNKAYDNPAEKDLIPSHYGGAVYRQITPVNGHHAGKVSVYYD